MIKIWNLIVCLTIIGFIAISIVLFYLVLSGKNWKEKLTFHSPPLPPKKKVKEEDKFTFKEQAEEILGGCGSCLGMIIVIILFILGIVWLWKKIGWWILLFFV